MEQETGLLEHILLHDYGVSAAAISQARQDMTVFGGSLATNLLELNVLSEADVLAALSKRYGTPSFDLSHEHVDPAMASVLSPALAAKHRIFPLKTAGRTLHLLMSNPLDRVAQSDAAVASGCIVKPYVVMETRLEQLLVNHAGLDAGWRYDTPGVNEPASTGARKMLLSGPARAPRSAAAGGSRPLTAMACRSALQRARDRDEVAEILVHFLLRYFRRVVVFVVRKEFLVGWRGGLHRDGADAVTTATETAMLEALYIPMNKPSLFQTVATTGAQRVGGIAADKVHDYFYKVLGGGHARAYPKNAWMAPVAIGRRTVNLVYGDWGPGQSIACALDDPSLAVVSASEAYERLIRERAQQAT